MSEAWLPIPGYEGMYTVSDHGRVYSVRRVIDCAPWGRAGNTTRTVGGRMLKAGRMTAGHMSVALGKGNSRCVHALVLLAFVGPPPAGKEACHRDGDPSRNHLGNLYYGSRGRNTKDDKWRGAMRKGWVASVEAASQVKLLLAQGGMGHAAIAEATGVTKWVVDDISRGRTHKEVPLPHLLSTAQFAWEITDDCL